LCNTYIPTLAVEIGVTASYSIASNEPEGGFQLPEAAPITTEAGDNFSAISDSLEISELLVQPLAYQHPSCGVVGDMSSLFQWHPIVQEEPGGVSASRGMAPIMA
jgi:hypothetical protein